MANQAGLSDAEREVLKVLWDLGEGTVREINLVLEERVGSGPIRRWPRCFCGWSSRSTPRAIPGPFRTCIAALVSRDELLDRRLKDAAEELCDGRAAPLVLALVQGNRFSADELERVRRMLEEAAGRPSSTGKPRSSRNNS